MANPVIRRNTNIGAADAEADASFLKECFIDNGDAGILCDPSDPRCLVLGRTGVGKTALLNHIAANSERCSEFAPEALALNYITNSTVLQFFEAAGVSLDMFYQLLWRHIIVVELLKLRFQITNENKQKEFFSWFAGIFSRDRAKARALEYVRDWGDKFWEETEYRTKEFTEKLETDLKASAGASIGNVHLGAEGARKLSREALIEVKERGAEIVNKVQVKELHDIIGFLAEDVFVDSQQPFYLIIDRLDEGWADDRIRFKLIKALIEAIRSFRKISSVKIILALRTDLHYRVLKETVNAGSQEEKYRSLYLPLRWTREQLVRMLDERVSYLFKRQYTGARVSLVDILPTNQMEKRTPVEYILDRTFFRPREAIIFLNECLAQAEGQTRITAQIIRKAEVPYSKARLLSLADEWRREYPRLLDTAGLLSHRPAKFELGDITKDECISFVERFLLDNRGTEDPIYGLSEWFFVEDTDPFPLLKGVFEVLYRVGVVGVKPDPSLGRQWSFDGIPVLTDGMLKPTTQISIHKTFWAVLGIIPQH